MNTPEFPHPYSPAEDEALAALLRARFHFDAGRFVPLYLNGLPLGYLKQPWTDRVAADWPHGALLRDGAVHLNADNWLMLGDALEHMAYGWHGLGYLNGWRSERFAAEDGSGQMLFALERAAFRPLGLCSRAVHINGFGQTGQGWGFWIGRRSPFKAVDPDKLDNIVGGGVTAGERPADALLREGFEEAGLSPAQLADCTEQDRLLSLREVPRGLHREWLHIFDAVLPRGCRPENQDGEVAQFMLLEPPQLLEAMLAGRMMNDALLATLSACLRHGLLPQGGAVAQWLHFQHPEEAQEVKSAKSDTRP